MKINLNVQILRALAVLVVILNHLGVFGFKGGFYGVDLFFVISGYVISSQLLLNNNLLDFYKKRINRILPSSFITVILTLLASFLILGQFSTKNILEPVKSIGTLSVNFFFAQHYNNYFDLGSSTSPFLHFWSLAVEEQFYLFIPILFLLFANKYNKLLKLSTYLLVISSLTYFLYLSNNNPNLAFYSVFSRAWELGLGVLIAIHPINNFKVKKSLTTMLWYLALTVFIFFALILENSPFNLILVSAISTLLVLLATLIPENRNYLESIFANIGNASYSIYLVHFPIIILFLRKNSSISFFEGTILFLLSIPLGFILYKLFEKPTRNKLNSLNNRYSSYLILLLVSALSILSTNFTNQEPKSVSNVKNVQLSSQLSTLLSKSLESNYSPKILKPELALIHGQLDLVDGVGECTSGANMCTKEILKTDRLVVLFGDSHATMWWSSLYQASLKNNFNAILFSKGGCPPALLAYNEWGNNTPTKEKYDECVTWFKRSINAIRDLNPNTLIITGSGTTSNWASKLPETFGEFTELSSRKILLGDFSYPEQNILDCYSANSNSPSPCTHSLVDNIIKSHREAEIEFTNNNNDWELFFPDTLLCLKDRCPGIVDGIYVYRDQWHLTRLYGQLIANDFANLLKLNNK